MLYGAVGKVGLRAFAAPFSPAQLFASGEIGAWYDPSDLTTMFQDSAGTTPVTAVGQKVGLILDKSQGLAIGSELVTNGDFSNGTTGWSGAGGNPPTLASVSGELRLTSNVSGVAANGAEQILTTVANQWYKVTGTLRNGTSTDCRVRAVNGTAAGTILAESATVTATSNTQVVLYFMATSTATSIYLRQNSTATGQTCFFDNISVVTLAGNHASQTTDTAKPILSARVNLLTYSEQFDNAAWTKLATTSSAPSHTDPLGGSTACLVAETTNILNHLISQIVAFTSGVSYTISVALKKGTGATAPDWMQITFPSAAFGTSQYANFNLSTGAAGTVVGGTSSIQSIGNGWYRVSFTATATSSASSGGGVVFNNNSDASGRVPSYAGATTSDVFVWGADLRPSNQVSAGMPAYQRIAAATDYDTTGFPYYLSFDGTDDFLVTGTINPGSVDKAQVFAGVRKLSDATRSIVAETGTGSSNGTIAFEAPFSPSATYGLYSRGTIQVRISSTTEYPSPITNVASVIADISAPSILLRVNGAQNVTNSSTQGTGSYSSQALYIGRRGGTTLPFNGNIYSLIVRFSAANLSDSVISQAETWVNTKTLAY